MWHTYTLKSKKYNQLYTGSTNNINRRLKEHNHGDELSTKRYRPWEVLYYEAYQTEDLARLRERRLKYNGNAMRELKKRIGILPSTTSCAKSGAGFTLIETLVAIAIFTLMMGGVSALTVTLYRNYSFTWEQSIAIDEARRGIETMVKEIREARTGDDGSYSIEQAGDNELIFYSDIDQDDRTERIRYFLGTVGVGSQTQDCVTFSDGGSCSVIFADFLTGELVSAEVRVSVEGDFGRSNEYAEIFADGINLGDVCRSGCDDCAATWQGTTTYDVTDQAVDDSIQFTADATWRVNDFCDWQEPNHAMKAQFELSWTENIPGADNELKRGVIDPTDPPVEYPLDQETVKILTRYVHNTPPIFEYFDGDGNKIQASPARLVDTKLMKVYLEVDVDPNRSPSPFQLESSVQIRNLKEE